MVSIDRYCVRLGPDPRFWVLVFGHETWRPNADAVSSKLERHVAAEAGDSTKKAVSSAYTKSVKISRPIVIPGLDFMCRSIQLIATQKSAGARTHPVLRQRLLRVGPTAALRGGHEQRSFREAR